MKRNATFFALIFCFTIVLQGYSQTINQKLITGITTGNSLDAYSLKYNAATGGWVYADYDTTTKKYAIISPKGSSKPFSYTMQYNTLFDSEGNSYMIASENVTDTVYRYSVVKNNEAIAVFDYVNEGWVIKDDILYYAAQESGKSYMVTYDTKYGTLTKSKGYDEVRLSYTPSGYSEGEPVGYVGFTKAGQVYYVARSGDETFLVIGDSEQKHYSDISWYDMKFNSKDEPCYVAKSQGKFYEERGNTFLVKGTTEYKTFDWVYGPIEFDNAGSPIYTGQDSVKDYLYRVTLMNGSIPVTSVTGSIYNYTYTPQGKFTYVMTETKPSANGESVNQSYLVIDDKKSKPYVTIYNPVFSPSGKVMFSGSDKNNKYFVVNNGEVISEKYDYISEAKFLPTGKIAYVGVKYGNYDKNIPDKSYVVIDGETYGPYSLVNTVDWVTNSIVIGDTKGNYAFIAGELIDKVNYTYKYLVVSNVDETKKYDNISDMKLVNGKLVYFAGNIVNKDTYLYNYGLHVNNKKISETYSAYTDLKISPEGNMTFIAARGNDFYYVEAKP